MPATSEAEAEVVTVQFARPTTTAQAISWVHFARRNRAAALVMHYPFDRPQARSSLLTEQELRVIWWASRGYSNSAIGETMGCPPSTVKSHLARISKKVGTGDRAGIVSIALRRGWIS